MDTFDTINFRETYINNKTSYFNLHTNAFYVIGGAKNLAKQKMQKKDNFYFVHLITDENVLLDILNDGYIRRGDDPLNKNKKHILSAEDLPYIYTNINFVDLNNIDTVACYVIILSPPLFYDYGSIFNKGWFKYPYPDSIHIQKEKKKKEKHTLLKQIKNYISNPTFYPKKLIENAGYRAHEILFHEPIPLDKYMIAINCCHIYDQSLPETMKKIKIIIQNKYPNVKILNLQINEKGLIEPPSLNNIKDIKNI